MSTEYLNYIAGVSQTNKLARNKSKGETDRDKGLGHLVNHKNSDVEESIHFKSKDRKYRSNRKSILIVESDSKVNSMLGLFASAMGYDYEIVDDGSLALEKTTLKNRRGKKHYDVIILDTHLDKFSGLDVAEEIHNKDLSQRIMIISHTPKKDLNNDLLKKIDVHESDIFTKPFRLSELLYAIDR